MGFQIRKFVIFKSIHYSSTPVLQKNICNNHLSQTFSKASHIPMGFLINVEPSNPCFQAHLVFAVSEGQQNFHQVRG